MGIRGTTSRTLTAVAVLSVIGLLGLSACGGGTDSVSTSDSAGRAGSEGQAGSAGDAPSVGTAGSQRDAGSNADSAAALPSPQSINPDSALNGQKPPELLTGTAMIKTGAVALRSADIGHVITQVYGIVGGVGGDISREDTTTDDKGKAVRSTLALRVPVEEFDATLNNLSQLGTLTNRVSSSKDVTTAVADIDSRVRSAQRSINTLRQLFDRANKLSDIIRLESELSQREANLESLQAQQRALSDKTTMSTITMTLEPAIVAPKPKPKPRDDKAGGFVDGIQQGWDALKATTIAVGHGVGVVLPLGTLALLVAAFAYWFVRRVAPRHPSTRAETAEV